jgi:hypothetical protein
MGRDESTIYFEAAANSDDEYQKSLFFNMSQYPEIAYSITPELS